MREKDLVCLDTQILLWAIKEESSDPKNTNMIRWAKLFLRELDKWDDVRVMIPSVVVAELMIDVDMDKYETAIEILKNHIMIAPFDLSASLIYSRIWNQKSDIIKSLIDSREMSKSHIKYNCQIISSAVAQEAVCIYSYDEYMKVIADKIIDVHKMPSVQDNLPNIDL